MSANDRQVAGSHYIGVYQHWDYVIDGELNYFAAQVSKYIIRWRKKNGLQDLEKALHFWEKYKESVLSGRIPLPVYKAPHLARGFSVSILIAGHPRLSITECEVLRVLVNLDSQDAVQRIHELLQQLIADTSKQHEHE